ncbi:MAG TPA: hypothetical protein VMM13_17370 [Euzebya sp.]|nr:hypothetical protein [Euzebya sp.]
MSGRGSDRTSTPGQALGALIGLLLGLAFVTSMVTILVTIAIWPGEAVLTAPLLCPDSQPDAFVVADTVSVQPGETSTNFTLYCVGPRGDFTDTGFLRPFLLLMGGHGIVMVILAAAVWGLRMGGRGRARHAPSPAGTWG